MAWIKGAPSQEEIKKEKEKKKKKARKDWIKRVNVKRKSEGLGPVANNPSRHGYSEPGWELRDTDWMTSNPIKRHFRYEDGTTKPSPSRAGNRPPTASKRNWPSGWRSLKRDRGIPGYSHAKHKVGKVLTKHAPSLSEAFKLDDQAPEYSLTRPRAKSKYRSLTEKKRLRSEAGKSRAEKKRLKEEREKRRQAERRAAERRTRLLNPTS
tara:strand:+ start:2399 stop:3025 length:627 start_codon:yes stop_codon:yes gene_type:complete